MRGLVMGVVAGMLAAGVCRAQSVLPNSMATPGAVNPEVTQENIRETICVPGWTRSVRPPLEYTRALKRQQVRAAGFADQRLGPYEEDHLIPLDLGGAPFDPRNLWPEPRVSADGWTADRKDELEAVLGRLVCEQRVPLVEAQRAIASNWIEAYRRFVGGE